jgi:hypothetical protein
MDFGQLLLEYKFKTTEKKRGHFWWKDQPWNKNAGDAASGKIPRVRKEKVERSFQRSDYILSISGGFEASFSWLLSNNCLSGNPICPQCCAEMELGGGGCGGQMRSMDTRSYRCR